jgi:hypothetical protein
MNCDYRVASSPVRVRIAYSVERFFDQQCGDFQAEPTSRMAVGSKNSFHFILLVDGGDDGLRVLVEALFGAQLSGRRST